MQDPSSAADLTPARQRIACFVINLDRDRARLDDVARGLAAVDVAFERHPAINGKRHGALIRRLIRQDFHSRAKQRPMTDGEIGCTLSHLSVYRRMLREGVEKALILEDDAVFEPEFASFFANHLGALLDRFDIVKIEGIFFDHVSADATTLASAGGARAVLPLRPTLGTAAYALTRRGAKRLLKALSRFDDPLDIKLVQYERHRTRFVELRPMLVRQADVASSLEADRVRAETGETPASPGIVAKLAERVAFARRVISRMGVWLFWVVESRLRGGAGKAA